MLSAMYSIQPSSFRSCVALLKSRSACITGAGSCFGACAHTAQVHIMHTAITAASLRIASPHEPEIQNARDKKRRSVIERFGEANGKVMKLLWRRIRG